MNQQTEHKRNDERRVSAPALENDESTDSSPAFGEEGDSSSAGVEGREQLSSESEQLPALARRAVEIFISEQRRLKPPQASPSSILSRRAACFVSIKTAERQLRGCMGTIEPACRTLAQELIANAISAATRDPRFLPVTREELPHLRFSVDVLSAPEPTRLEDLDPKIFGVIVEDETGRQRGLLLPDIEGIDSPAQQVAIAARKAGLAPQASLRLYRFRVRRFREQTP